ncbi:MAG: molybdopterin-binding/glycosyltransferase family 2 protein [Pseudomonadota bacterium]
MKFGALPLNEAEGAFLAHSVRAGDLALKKGRVLDSEDIERLGKAGIETVTAARLSSGDVAEDEAAARIATAVLGNHVEARAPFTGRVNLFAAKAGVLILDHRRIDRLNRIDEAMTIATLPPFSDVREGQMVATVKIIPFAVAESRLAEAITLADEVDGGLLQLAPYRPLDVQLIQTRLPSVKASVLDKTVGVTASRIAALGGRLIGESRSSHDVGSLSERIKSAQGDLILIAGASAITDRRDVLPSAIEAAGGDILHLGMPVDPGNLLLLGKLGDRPVLGLPGCARSPRPNGFDWVLQRLFAGLEVTRDDVMGMGVGGLLTEIESRPQPRNRRPSKGADMKNPGAVAGLVLAAGRSTRMGRENKLLAEIDGRPMVTHAVDAMLKSKADPVIVVTGHEAAAVRAALADLKITFVHNPEYADGLSTSLAAGLDALPEMASGALVGLGDMPRIRASDIDRLIAAFNPAEGQAICVPTVAGKRGNPVLFSTEFVPEMREVEGDVGARHLIGVHQDQVCEVEMEDDASLIDVDTKEALSALAPLSAFDQ